IIIFFFSSRRRHTRCYRDWSSDVCSSDLFFAGLLCGRGIAAAILLHLKEVTVAVGGLLLAAAGESIFLAAHSPFTLFGGAFLAEIGRASCRGSVYLSGVMMARERKRCS